jgi:hypothetical protein
MRRSHITRRIGLAVLALAPLPALGAMASLAAGYSPGCGQIILRVRASNDPKCKVGTVGRATLFASYNGVRSDSVQFFFPAACRDQDHLYHGTQVNNQVPPL